MGLILIGSFGSSGRAVGYQSESEVRIPVMAKSIFHCSLCPRSTKWVARFLRPGESKGGEESNGKLSHNAVCQEQSVPRCLD
ncbi:hypothetical protein PoB_006485600 [Plakobranchus ocellatus]|uniref:Uncharacterized protein n=1 Tax=Plakobranchus ocellatus TaxID=259542 RepID=A0AAV4D2F0_9GAST|nr:hypothetical protein PoB_006485600 [Plakobranchus ocellatus]